VSRFWKERRFPLGHAMSSIGLALFALPVMSGCDSVPPSPKSAGMLPPGLSAPPPSLQPSSSASVIMPLSRPGLTRPPEPAPSPASSSPLASNPSGLPSTPPPALQEPGKEGLKLQPPTSLLNPGEKPSIPGTGPASIESFESEGYTIHLASSLVTAGSNPFLDRLPRSLVALPTMPSPDSGLGPSGPSVVAPINMTPPVDPFQGVQVVGILYNPKKPMALLMVANSGSKMVTVGTVLSMPDAELRVTQIRRDAVELQRVGDKKHERRKLALPSILGFNSGGSTSVTTSVIPSPSATSAAPPTSGKSGLNNFTRLMEDGALLPQPSTSASTTQPPSGPASLSTTANPSFGTTQTP
jgi:hypothetical protein